METRKNPEGPVQPHSEQEHQSELQVEVMDQIEEGRDAQNADMCDNDESDTAENEYEARLQQELQE
jgi:hypothetical protein